MVWSSPIQREESIEIPLTYSKDTVLVNYGSKATQLFTCLENSGLEEAIDIYKEQPSQASIWVYWQISFSLESVQFKDLVPSPWSSIYSKQNFPKRILHFW